MVHKKKLTFNNESSDIKLDHENKNDLKSERITPKEDKNNKD